MTADQQFTEEDVQRYAEALMPLCGFCSGTTVMTPYPRHIEDVRAVLAALVEDGWTRLDPAAKTRIDTEWAVAVPWPGESVAGMENRGAHECDSEAGARELSAEWRSPVIHREVRLFAGGGEYRGPWEPVVTRPEGADQHVG